MTIVNGDILEVSARMEFSPADDVVNVFQFQNSTIAPMTDEQGIDDVIEFVEAIYLLITGALSLLTLYRDIRVRNITQGVVYGVFPWPTLNQGSNPADPVAPGVAMLSSFSTGIARVVPRKYWGVLSDVNMSTDGQWTAAAVALFGTQAALMLVTYVATTGSWDYGYFSPKTAAFQLPTGAVVSSIPAYQRRRRQGRGS